MNTYTEQTKEQLIKTIVNLEEDIILNFAKYKNGDDYEAYYATQKLRWLDSKIVLIGGYDTQTFCRDIGISGEEKEAIIELVNEWWNYSNPVCVYVENQ